MSDEAGSPVRVPVWDGPVRLIHWMIVGLVAFSYWTYHNYRMDWHAWSGFTVIGLLVFRIYWGFAGSRTARFAHFVKGPKHIFAYAGSFFKPKAHPTIGHNPMGALSVVAIILTLCVQVITGLMSTDIDNYDPGPWNRFLSWDQAEAVTKIHATSFNVLLGLIVLHVAVIAFYLVFKRDNLIGPMVTGRRKVEAIHAENANVKAGWIRFLIGVALAVAFGVFAAKGPELFS